MLSGIFAFITLMLKLCKVWDQFLDYNDLQRKAEAERKNQDRAVAIEDAKKAQTPEEAFASQERIVRNKP